MNWVGGARSRIKLRDDKKQQKEYFERKRFSTKVERAKALDSPNRRKRSISFDLLSLQTVINSHDSKKRKHGENLPSNVTRINLDKIKPVYRRYEDIELPMSPCKVPSKLLLSDTPERKQRTCMHSSKSDNHSICVDNQSLKNQRRNACSLNLSMKHPEKSFIQKAIVHCDVEKTWKEESTIHQPQSHVHDDKENFSFVSQQIKRPPPPSEISYLPYSQPAPKSSFHSSVNWKRSHLPIGFMPSEMLEPVEEIEQIEKKPTMIDDHNFESFMEEQKRRTRSYSLHSRESSPQSDSSDFSWSDSETAQESMYTDTWNKTKDTLERKLVPNPEVSNINSKAEPERARDQVNIDNPLLMTTPKRPRPSSTDGNQCSSQTLDLKCLEIMSDILDDDDDSKQKEFSYPVCHTPNASTMLTESKILQGHSKDGEEKYQHNLQNMLLHRDSIWKKSTFTRDKKVETTEKTVTPQHSRWRDFIKQPNGNNRANQSCVSGSKENDPNMVLNGSPEYTMQKIMPSQPPQGSGSFIGDADDNAEQPPDLHTTSKMNETVVSEDALTHDGLAHDKNHTNGKISVYFLDEPQLQKKTEDEHLAIEMKFAEEAMKEVMTLDEVINEASHPKFSVSDAQSGITDLSRLGDDLNFHIPQPSLEMLSSDDQQEPKAACTLPNSIKLPLTNPAVKKAAIPSCNLHHGKDVHHGEVQGCNDSIDGDVGDMNNEQVKKSDEMTIKLNVSDVSSSQCIVPNIDNASLTACKQDCEEAKVSTDKGTACVQTCENDSKEMELDKREVIKTTYKKSLGSPEPSTRAQESGEHEENSQVKDWSDVTTQTDVQSMTIQNSKFATHEVQTETMSVHTASVQCHLGISNLKDASTTCHMIEELRCQTCKREIGDNSVGTVDKSIQTVNLKSEKGVQFDFRDEMEIQIRSLKYSLRARKL